ncbi:hypothetical protein [Magnetofaba australis]|uniref:hypothetical protein n=1 Tax=Magnetofaba australis TaxID=1472297 RepID=UPI000A19BDC6|nr:hypothetical protein [Magnetofaba australis]
MPVNEFTAQVQAGDTFTAPAAGNLEFTAAPPPAPPVDPAAAAAKPIAMTAVSPVAAPVAQSVPSQILSGKVLGLSLASVNPWILLGVGAVGGYFYFKKKRFSFF